MRTREMSRFSRVRWLNQEERDVGLWVSMTLAPYGFARHE